MSPEKKLHMLCRVRNWSCREPDFEGYFMQNPLTLKTLTTNYTHCLDLNINSIGNMDTATVGRTEMQATITRKYCNTLCVGAAL